MFDCYDTLITPEEVADMLGCGMNTTYKLLKSGKMSEQRLSYNEAIKSAKLEELYRRAYKILHNNKYFLLAVQHGLLEHETLLNSDLAKIRESCI